MGEARRRAAVVVPWWYWPIAPGLNDGEGRLRNSEGEICPWRIRASPRSRPVLPVLAAMIAGL